jgi:UDP-N-acetylmuramyl pentapeptide phosphotransferase/UDP-N-acetylglucosamine-1-phosphate transferase
LPDCLQLVGLSIVVTIASYSGVAGLRAWAERQHILDIPNERSSHTLPTPRGGGLVIVVLSTIGLGAACFLYPVWSGAALVAFLAGAWLIAVVSWLDDLRSLSNRVRFTAHILGAVLAVWAFGYWYYITVPLAGSLRLGLLGLPIAFLWIVGFTNAYNFMDGIDGIAGAQAVIAGLGWVAIGWLTTQPLVAVMGVLLSASSLGFLGQNWPPARIFMGDVGSAFLGYTFAVLCLAAAKADSRLAAVGILFVWPFVFDTTFTLLRRLRHHENIFVAHRSHLYQRLVIVGYNHRSVTILYTSLAAWGAIWALLWSRGIAGSAIVIAVSIPSLCLGLWMFVNRREGALRDQPAKTGHLTP